MFFLPKGMELVILANSPLCQPDHEFMNRVLDLIDRNIHLRLLTIVAAATAVFGIAGLVKRARARRRP